MLFISKRYIFQPTHRVALLKVPGGAFVVGDPDSTARADNPTLLFVDECNSKHTLSRRAAHYLPGNATSNRVKYGSFITNNPSTAFVHKRNGVQVCRRV